MALENLLELKDKQFYSNIATRLVNVNSPARAHNLFNLLVRDKQVLEVPESDADLYFFPLFFFRELKQRETAQAVRKKQKKETD